jgi:phosphate/sulfate permease
VIGRVVRVLESFDRDRPTMTLSSLAARAGLPLSTTHRLVEELMGYGLIHRADSGVLRIGLRMWEISARSLVPKTGAGLIVALTGAVMTMPGLPSLAAAMRMGVNDDGEITGHFQSAILGRPQPWPDYSGGAVSPGG